MHPRTPGEVPPRSPRRSRRPCGVVVVVDRFQTSGAAPAAAARPKPRDEDPTSPTLHDRWNSSRSPRTRGCEGSHRGWREHGPGVRQRQGTFVGERQVARGGSRRLPGEAVRRRHERQGGRHRAHSRAGATWRICRCCRARHAGADAREGVARGGAPRAWTWRPTSCRCFSRFQTTASSTRRSWRTR